jgi:histidyl-tRNA synthetase
MGLSVVLHCGGAEGAGSFKSQMKKADASGAAYALILGEDEVATQTITIKSLRRDGEQVKVDAVDAASYLMQQIAGV